MSLPMCSCGRAQVELGNDLCGHCRADYFDQVDAEAAAEAQAAEEWEAERYDEEISF